MMNKFYCKSSCSPCFKDYLDEHMRWEFYNPIDRKLFRIFDLKLWFESNFEEGEELIIKRVSRNGKYDFKR